MFAGHLGAGLALRRGSRVGLGVLLLSALLPDVVLWVLVLAGVETVSVPPQYRTAADLRFDFPYSHSLTASLLWSLLAGTVYGWMGQGNARDRRRGAWIVGAAVFSHFILDWLVHVPELPLAGRDSTKLGLGLWQHLTLAWGVEGLMVLAGLWLYLRGRRLSASRRRLLIALVIVLMAMTVAGQARAAPPPPPAPMAISSLVAMLFVCALGFWVDREQSDHPRGLNVGVRDGS